MKNSISTIMFLTRLTAGRCGGVRSAWLVLETGSGKIPVRVYRKSGRSRARGTILSVGGLSVRGTDDPRIVLLNSAMARAGFTVIAPSYRDIDSFRITGDTLDEVVETVRAVCKRKDLSPSGTLSLIAPSFSGGICLAAAARHEVADRIDAVCTIGTFGNVGRVLRFLMENVEGDEYGRLIVMHNFIHYSVGKRPELQRALELAYLDNGFHREKPELDPYLASISAENRELFQELRHNRDFRTAVWAEAEKKVREEQDIFEVMDVTRHIGNIKARCVFIHGKHDNVIPASESEYLHRELARMGIKSTLAVTPLISHGDTTYRLSMLPDLVALVGAFKDFFRSAESAGRKRMKGDGARRNLHDLEFNLQCSRNE